MQRAFKMISLLNIYKQKKRQLVVPFMLKNPSLYLSIIEIEKEMQNNQNKQGRKTDYSQFLKQLLNKSQMTQLSSQTNNFAEIISNIQLISSVNFSLM